MEVKAVFLGWKGGDGNLTEKPLPYWTDLIVGVCIHLSYMTKLLFTPSNLKGEVGCVVVTRLELFLKGQST